MRQYLFEFIFIVGGVIGSRFIFSSHFKADSKLGKVLTYVVGGVIGLWFYVTWARTGMDPMQLTVCAVYSGAPACEEKKKTAPPATAQKPIAEVPAPVQEPRRTIVTDVAREPVRAAPIVSPSKEPEAPARPVEKKEFFTN